MMAAPFGFDHDRVAGANSVLEVSEWRRDRSADSLPTAVAAAARDTALALLRGAPTDVEVVIVGRDGALLGRAGALAHWRLRVNDRRLKTLVLAGHAEGRA
jgi:cobalt-precorrin-5B (C1)-methyltransferase